MITSKDTRYIARQIRFSDLLVDLAIPNCMGN